MLLDYFFPLKMERSNSSHDPCSKTSHLHQWSADFSKISTSGVVIVKKSKKEPEPPRRSVSLPQPQPAEPTSKRHSCPAFGITAQNSPPPSSISACSSPPLIQTSTITGPDPLGWNVRHKSGNSTSRSCAGRLSLQTPLSDIFPKTKSQLSTNSDPSRCPKPIRRHNSDSLAFLRSSGISLPVTKEELCTVELRHAHNVSDSDDVFEKNVKKTEQNIKEPPPVPIKSEMARQVAHLIAFSREPSVETMANHDELVNTKV